MHATQLALKGWATLKEVWGASILLCQQQCMALSSAKDAEALPDFFWPAHVGCTVACPHTKLRPQLTQLILEFLVFCQTVHDDVCSGGCKPAQYAQTNTLGRSCNRPI